MPGPDATAPPPPAPRRLYLRRREEHRLRNGHPWVFANEVDPERTPLSALAPGEVVEVRSHAGRLLGTAYANPHALICARLYARGEAPPLDRDLVARRVRRALALRERLYPAPCYRLVYGESDGLPGLVVDRHRDVLAVCLNTAGMERIRDEVLAALVDVVAPRGVVLRNDAPARALEGLERAVEVVHGEVPEEVPIEEGEARFLARPRDGQKTGWYYDQRENRDRLARYVAGARVLDLFSYAGAWGVRAALAGAREVLCVDSSRAALDQVSAHARLNRVEGVVEARRGDAFEALRGLRDARRRFDVVVADPPAFVRRRKDLRAGIEAYQRLARHCLQVLGDDGFLVSASCSSHVGEAAFADLLRAAAAKVGRRLQILERGHQSADHPVHPGMPESEYLKALFVRAVAA